MYVLGINKKKLYAGAGTFTNEAFQAQTYPNVQHAVRSADVFVEKGFSIKRMAIYLLVTEGDHLKKLTQQEIDEAINPTPVPEPNPQKPEEESGVGSKPATRSSRDGTR